MNENIKAIAKRVLGIHTLQTQHSDRKDFHSLSVWEVRTALEDAYRAGMKDAAKQERERIAE